jgi:hypothetical protein
MGLVPEKQGGGVGDKFITDMFHWNKSVQISLIGCLASYCLIDFALVSLSDAD